MKSRRRDTIRGRGPRSHASTLLIAALATMGVSSLLVVSGSSQVSPLGVPSYWPWLLTGLQVLALWSAGRGQTWGWLLGGSVQLPWIVYALLTSQLGFIPGCAVSAAVQLNSFRTRAGTSPGHSHPAGPNMTLTARPGMGMGGRSL